jgi:glucan 1,3-beta-glucosidase
MLTRAWRLSVASRRSLALIGFSILFQRLTGLSYESEDRRELDITCAVEPHGNAANGYRSASEGRLIILVMEGENREPANNEKEYVFIPSIIRTEGLQPSPRLMASHFRINARVIASYGTQAFSSQGLNIYFHGPAMMPLPRCASLLLLVALSVVVPGRAQSTGFSRTDPNSPVGYVLAKDSDAQSSPFINEVDGDTASIAFANQAPDTPAPITATATHKPRRKSTRKPTPTPTPTASENYSTPANGSAQSSHIQYAIRSGNVPSQGVNLGGWLVSEHWMNKEAEIWKGLTDEQAGTGEQTAFTHSDYDTAVARFTQHRDTFITEDEIAAIARAGLNTVRVPVGYWIVGFDHHDPSDRKQWKNFAPGGLAYLDRLIRGWAKMHNVAVLISMHAAKGSQNGADHSSPEQPAKSLWSSFPENLASTLDAVKFLAARYKGEDAFLGIGLMNEPGGTTSNQELYKYYEDAYQAIRKESGNDCILTIAPLLWEQSANFMTDLLPGATNVWVEWHRYFVWGYETASEDELLGSAMDKFRDDVNAWKGKSDKKMFIGEFSFATAGKFQDTTKLKQFGQKQLDVLQTVVNGGWTFWSWRIYGDENGVNPWSLRSLLRNGIFSLSSPGQQSS